MGLIMFWNKFRCPNILWPTRAALGRQWNILKYKLALLIGTNRLFIMHMHDFTKNLLIESVTLLAKPLTEL